MRRYFLIFILLISVYCCGCQSIRPRYSLFRSDDDRATTTRFETEQEKRSFGDRLAGDILTFTFFEAIPAMVRGVGKGIQKKLQR